MPLRLLLLCLCALPLTVLAQNRCAKTEVHDEDIQGSWGYGVENHRYQANTAITPDNVDRLKRAWVYKLDDKSDPHSFPLVTADSVIVGSRGGVLHALDKTTGCLRWQYDAGADIRTAITAGDNGLLYFGTAGGDVVALDLKSGRHRWTVPVDRHFAAMVTGSPTYYKGRLYVPVSSFEMFVAVVPFYPCCDFQGAVVALDAKSGKYLWRTRTIGEPPKKVGVRWFVIPQYAPSGVPVWSAPAVDTQNGQLLIGTGENYSSPATETSDSIMVLDLETGAIRWSRQFTAGDAWNVSCETMLDANCPEEQGPDFDFGAPPMLLDGRVLAGQKSGMVYALDPGTGDVLWRYRGGSGGKLGGIHWGMAADPAGSVLYVPISDRRSDWIISRDTEGPQRQGVVALDVNTGEELWHTEHDAEVCTGKEDCFRGVSAALTASQGLVWGGGLDGVLRAYDAEDGKVLWSADTWGPLMAVNGTAEGGAFDVHGAFVDEKMVFISSGYGSFDQKGGNAFIAFRLDEE